MYTFDHPIFLNGVFYVVYVGCLLLVSKDETFIKFIHMGRASSVATGYNANQSLIDQPLRSMARVNLSCVGCSLRSWC